MFTEMSFKWWEEKEGWNNNEYVIFRWEKRVIYN